MSNDNLIPQNKRTKEEQREIARKGGIASGKARKEKIILRKLLEEALEKETKTGNQAIDITNAIIKKAKKGNVKAYEVIRDTLGQKPTENINIENPQATKVLESISKQLKHK